MSLNIILNELAWAEQMIAESSLGDNAFETMCRVAKYYKAGGSKNAETRRQLEAFLRRCDPYASVALWSDTIDRALRVASKYPPVMIDKIIVTKPEVETIRRLRGVQLQRLAFTLLCVAKYMMIIAPKTDGWVNMSVHDIAKMANMKPTYKRMNLMYGQLLDAGLLHPSKKISNLNVQVLFIQDGEAEIEVTDFRDLGNQFMRYIGKPYYVCQNCGLTVKVPPGCRLGSMKYCQACAVKVRMQQNINSVMRIRGVPVTDGAPAPA